MGDYIVSTTIIVLVVSLAWLSMTCPISSLAVVTRGEWGGRQPKMVENINQAVPHVLIHHSYIPSHCNSTDKCKKAMQNMQDFHQIDRGWDDIGYNFAIGGDGQIYEGRGFNVRGAHAPPYNNESVGICLIGDWSNELPTPDMIENVHRLIDFGISTGKIQENYTLLGHRQARNTECPGDRLFNEISTWKHFVNLPRVQKNDDA